MVVCAQMNCLMCPSGTFTVLRAALTQAVRWGWISRNPASLAELRSRKVQSRGVMSAADVRAVVLAGHSIGAEVGLMLQLAAVTGARRAELAALRWEDVADGVVTIDSAIETDRRSGSTVLADARPRPQIRGAFRLTRQRLLLWNASVRSERSSGRGCSPLVTIRQIPTGSGTGGGSRVTRPASMRSGGCTICATGRPRLRSLRVTT